MRKVNNSLETDLISYAVTPEQFDVRWHAVYPETIWLPYLFRDVYPDRWFRIHSLPNSKRYASNPAEWSILLTRQNTLLTDLLGTNKEIVVVDSEYQVEGVDLSNTDPISDALSTLSFVPTKHRIDLHKLSPIDYEPGTFYQARFSEQVWQPHKFDELLREIAEDQTRAFFISWRKACIVAPYDGGVDVLLKDNATRNHYREKYRSWLSARPDGL